MINFGSAGRGVAGRCVVRQGRARLGLVWLGMARPRPFGNGGPQSGQTKTKKAKRMKSIKMQWTGIRPMLMHNGLLADPTNPFTRRMKEITSKGSKKLTDADYEERDKLEWTGSIYCDDKAGPYIPSDNIERCIQLGAQKSRIGKDVQAAVFCTDSIIPLQYDGPRNLEKLYADGRYQLRRGVSVNKSRIIRVRPMFPTGWWIEFDLEWDESILNEKSLVKACVDAGALIGLGDWRPKFGRFLVEVK